MRGNQKVYDRVNKELLGANLVISGITYYEVKRGFKNARSNGEFERLLGNIKIELLDDIKIFEEACTIYGICRNNGLIPAKKSKIADDKSVYDADILNAAVSKVKNLRLVTKDNIHKIGYIDSEDWTLT